MRHDTDAVSPWSFFLPVLLAVVIGSLIAGGIQHLFLRGAATQPAIDATSAVVDDVDSTAEGSVAATQSDAPPAVQEPAPVAPPLTDLGAPPPPAMLPDAAEIARPRASDASVLDAATADADVDADGHPRLPGPITARQSGASRSCINDTVADRSANGWEQALLDDAPQRCTATSQ